MNGAHDPRAAADAPLLPALAPETMLFEDAGVAVTPGCFLAEVERIAVALPEARYVVNLCADRYRYAISLFAALWRGQVTLLPMNPLPESLAALARQYPELSVVADEPLPHSPLPVWHYPPAPAPVIPVRGLAPAIPRDRQAVVLFTSGSTGEPVAQSRTWGALVASVEAAARVLDLDTLSGAALLGTVPHQHSYGLESVTLLALRRGLRCERTRPLLPADIAARLAALPAPRILVTTPVHLRALLDDGGPWPAVARIVCATALLAPELARRAEACFAAPLYEIYGCTEVGQIAVRRTVATEEWQCLDGIGLSEQAGEVWAEGPAAARRAALNDVLELRGGDRFILRGRKSDVVNVAGKRSSLAYLNHQLNAVPGVRDGVFGSATGDGEMARLTAYAVAPGLTAEQVLAALRRVLDPAFLPRPLHLVDELPRNALGKLPQRALDALGESACAWTSVEFSIAHDHPALPGHFPERPIVPGALLVDRALRAIATTAGTAYPGELRHVKFLHPVLPGATIELRWKSGKDDEIEFELRLAAHDDPAVTGAVKAARG
ncbi:MAG: AMP-binding protein [Gammaproteobacteria bacterium]|nr:AMP-binding protein [Gammaproteobacteria bacterium]MBI5615124.1 AMP-binding protein [Gammaproteobacteria bacterium]